MKKFLLLLTIIMFSACSLDHTEHSGYEFEFVFYNLDKPNELIVSPTINMEDGYKIDNANGELYRLQWSGNGKSFTIDFNSAEPFEFLWIEQWKTEHSYDSIPWQIVSPGTKYHVENENNILRSPDSGYYRFDIQRLK